MTDLKLFGTKCVNCGADYGDHSSLRNRCPVKSLTANIYEGSTKTFEAAVQHDPVQCCERDHNFDGNCDVHSSPGIVRLSKDGRDALRWEKESAS